MAESSMDQTMGRVVMRMPAAVFVVPVFRRLVYGSMHGDITRGALVGLSVLGFVTDPPSILDVFEPGIGPGITPIGGAIVVLPHGAAMFSHAGVCPRAPDLPHGAAR